MKIRIVEDERYPFFTMTKTDLFYPSGFLNVPQKKVNYWKRVMKEFEKVQDEMEAYYEGDLK